MNSILFSLIGVLVGSFITWNANRWLNKKKLRMDIEVKVVDHISDNIVGLQESLYKLHRLTETFILLVKVYFNDVLKNENTYEQIDNCDGEIYSAIHSLIEQYENFRIYFDIKEIVVKDSLVKFNNIDEAFWTYILELDGLSDIFVRDLYKSDLLDSIQDYLPQKDSSEILEELENTQKAANTAYATTLSALQGLNEELLNKIYGQIFNRKRDKKIYEVSCGRLCAVEKMYTEEKVKEIYRQHGIKRKFKGASHNRGFATSERI